MVALRFIYTYLILPLLWIGFHVGGILNSKIQRGIKGRKDLFRILQKEVPHLKGSKRIWFHASSLGEFEQAKPIIASIRRSYPQLDVIATFFSPSGYENSKNYKHANIITYLPFDTPSQVRNFLHIVRPDIAVMVRYDIWPNMVQELSRQKIPIILANATMRMNSPRLLPLIKYFHRSLYNSFSFILTVSASDKEAFLKFNTTVPRIEAIGDTRFDQVSMRQMDATSKNLLPHHITDGKKIFIIGQSWPEDEEVVLPAVLKLNEVIDNLLTIIVPHEPTVEHLENVEYELKGKCTSIRLSEIHNYKNERILLVDSIGVLVALYKYAHVAYVGGSFKQGIHNVLEPAIFGIPVLFGPRHTNSQEAVELVRRGAACVVTDTRSTYRTLRTFFDDESLRTSTGEISTDYVRTHCGATEKVLQYLVPFLTS